MKQLIISNYDSSVAFKVVILNNKKIEFESESEECLKDINLYDESWEMFDESPINSENEKIKTFDMIIVCEDGDIRIYRKGFEY